MKKVILVGVLASTLLAGCFEDPINVEDYYNSKSEEYNKLKDESERSYVLFYTVEKVKAEKARLDESLQQGSLTTGITDDASYYKKLEEATKLFGDITTNTFNTRMSSCINRYARGNPIPTAYELKSAESEEDKVAMVKRIDAIFAVLKDAVYQCNENMANDGAGWFPPTFKAQHKQLCSAEGSIHEYEFNADWWLLESPYKIEGPVSFDLQQEIDASPQDYLDNVNIKQLKADVKPEAYTEYVKAKKEVMSKMEKAELACEARF